MKPEDGLFQLSLGTDDGVERQQMLDIIRAGEWIGKLRVVLALKNQSVGKMDRKEEAKRIKIGDAITS